VNVGKKTIESHKGQEVPYDLLITIPPNFGAQVLMDSGLGDARPVGPLGMITGLSGAEARQGMGVMLELLKGLGRATQENGA
jgi:hypothetical protein